MPAQWTEPEKDLNSSTAGRKALFAALFIAFPLGASDEREALYLNQTRAEDFDDLREAISTLISNHDSSRVPAIAKLRRACLDARSKRVTQRLDSALEPGHILTDEEQRQASVVHALGRAGVYWCSKTATFAAPGEPFFSGHECFNARFELIDPRPGQIYAAEKKHLAKS
jgi:hypothetical protein